MKTELTAISIRLVSEKLTDALLEMGHYGGTIDLPTARHKISVAVASLELLAEILYPEPCLECDCSELGLEYTCCAKEEWEAEHAPHLAGDLRGEPRDGDPDTEWVIRDGNWVLQQS